MSSEAMNFTAYSSSVSSSSGYELQFSNYTGHGEPPQSKFIASAANTFYNIIFPGERQYYEKIFADVRAVPYDDCFLSILELATDLNNLYGLKSYYIISKSVCCFGPVQGSGDPELLIMIGTEYQLKLSTEILQATQDYVSSIWHRFCTVEDVMD
ncbi:hypothetical protein POM88_033990 [Heracleum sosnowskyi]|uniref:Uncharacterized protein n=1 Tax=Heracleum sosnowskyi TaxID=360622 RepID=A0AAD8HJJ7_9APIA|nr:hypothetical protein POM88_033990 [Heracleum sosnowskyi]